MLNTNSFWEYFKSKILSNKALVIVAVLVTVLCFGFAITHYSVGVDDLAREHYLFSNGKGSQIQQGRLIHHLYDLLTGTVDFIPFYNDFLGAALFCVSSLLFATLFQYVTSGKLSTASLMVFCGVYLSYSSVTEKFIYNLDTVLTMLSYCMVALALLFSCRFARSRSFWDFVMGAAALMIAVGTYESFLFLYFCGTFSIFILRIVVNKEKLGFKQLMKEGLCYAGILAASAAVYYGVVVLVQHATGQFGVFDRDNPWADSESGLVQTFIAVTRKIKQTLQFNQSLYVKEYAVFILIGAALFGVLSIRRRSFWLLACFGCMVAGSLGIHYVSGFLMHRAMQVTCLLVGFVAMLLIHQAGAVRLVKKTAVFLAVLLILVQAADTNRWFYNDYARYQKEKFVVDTIATQIVSECDVSKPVIFFGDVGETYLHTHLYPGRQVNGTSVLYWSVGTFSVRTSPMMHRLFRIHGYSFLIEPTEEQVERARIESVGMGCWPEQDYIREFDEYIVVKIAKIPE